MTVSTIALILLIMRFASMLLIGMVIRRQFKLFRLAIDTGLVQFRMVMFALGIVFLIGNIFPIIVDVYYAFIETNVAWEHNYLLVYYAVSNAIGALSGSFILWKIYKIAGGGDSSRGV